MQRPHKEAWDRNVFFNLSFLQHEMLFEFKGVSKKCISCKNMLILMLMTLHYQVLRQTEEVARVKQMCFLVCCWALVERIVSNVGDLFCLVNYRDLFSFVRVCWGQLSVRKVECNDGVKCVNLEWSLAQLLSVPLTSSMFNSKVLFSIKKILQALGKLFGSCL